MSDHTRFPQDRDRETSVSSKGRGGRFAEAERVFRDVPKRAQTQYERTSQVARQIVQDETEKRQTLTEALKTARLERARKSAKKAAAKPSSKTEE